MLKLILINICISKNYRSSITNQHANADGSEGTLAKYVWNFFLKFLTFTILLIIFFFQHAEKFSGRIFWWNKWEHNFNVWSFTKCWK